jgi:hypothetical protein
VAIVWCRCDRVVSRAQPWLAAAALCCACARRVEEHTQDAWERAARGASDEREKEATSGDGDGESRSPRRTYGWERIGSMIETARRLLARGADPDAIAQLADQWCAQEATPMQGRHGEVRVCVPAPPVSVAGHAFTLELGGTGVIGLVASELSGAQSTKLLQQALAQGSHWCAGSWTHVPVRDENAHEEFHTCPTRGGPTLAAGRFPKDLRADLWQVSVSVIGAG